MADDESDDAYRSIRLHVEAELAAGVAVHLPREQAHYVARVMRLAAGDGLALFNARDGEWGGRIDKVGRNDCSLTLERQIRPPAPLLADVWLLFAPLKRGATDFVIQKATELGVSVLMPVVTRRTVAHRINPERLVSIATEAAEQTERLDIPRIEELTPLDRVLDRWPAGRRLFYCNETGRGAPIADVLATAGGGPAAFLCGPEGGFTPDELDLIGRFPFATDLHLGPRILRADTAALAALAVWQAVCGDWRVRPDYNGAAL